MATPYHRLARETPAYAWWRLPLAALVIAATYLGLTLLLLAGAAVWFAATATSRSFDRWLDAVGDLDLRHVDYFVLDLLFAPRRRGLPWWSLAVFLAYPVMWIVYTMVRGLRVANPDGSTAWWYPYPFLDPHNGGYGSAFAYIAVMIVAFVAIGAIIIAIGRYREKRAAVRGGAPSAQGALPV